MGIWIVIGILVLPVVILAAMFSLGVVGDPPEVEEDYW